MVHSIACATSTVRVPSTPVLWYTGRSPASACTPSSSSLSAPLLPASATSIPRHSRVQPSPSRNPAKQTTHCRNATIPAVSALRWLGACAFLWGAGWFVSPPYPSYSIALALLGAVTDQTGDTITTPSPPLRNSRALPGPCSATPRQTPPTSSDQFTSTPSHLPPAPPATPTRHHSTPTTTTSDARSSSKATEPRMSSATSASGAAKPNS